jgi:phosphoribosylformimino-5-aminoimidazole carboxamide ribotide isomerase
LRDGHCVRLLRGDFAAETRYATEPRTLLDEYRRLGADWLHVVDLDGARDGRSGNRQLIVGLAGQDAIRLQVGGGMRDAESITRMLEAGVSRVVIGSAAVTRIEDVKEWLEGYGPERIVLAFDVRLDEGGEPRVAIHGWREQSRLSLWDAVANFVDFDLKHVLCTDVSRDGALEGPNVDLYADAVRRYPHIEWQASGGIRDARDLAALAAAGAQAAISGKALLEGLIPIEDLQPYLPNASSPA